MRVLLLGLVAAAVVAALAGGASSAVAAPNDTYFTATLTGAQENPPSGSTGTGSATLILNEAQNQFTIDVTYSGLTSNVTMAHIHVGAPGVNGGIVFDLTYTGGPSGTIPRRTFGITDGQVIQLASGNYYVNIHTVNFGGGEIRGQLAGQGPTAVRVTRATASRTRAGVLVRWRTAPERQTLGFNLYRVESGTIDVQHGTLGKLVKLNRTLIRAGKHAYSWLDRSAPAGKVRYQLQTVNLRGAKTWTSGVISTRG